MIYRPVREREPKAIIDALVRSVEEAGYDEASLTSLSTADYSAIAPLVYLCTVLGLCLAYTAGRFVPPGYLASVLSAVRMRRAAAFVADERLAWCARNASKPGRSGRTWVVHASPAWTREHLDADR